MDEVPVLRILLALSACSGGGGAAPGGAPVPVQVQVVAPAPLDHAVDGDGTLSAIDSVAVRPETAGVVADVLFEDGESVRAGQPLVRLRANDAQATLLEARSKAQLATVALGRARALQARGEVAQADLDDAVANDGLARAAVQRAQESVRRTTIAAPFAGRVGLHGVSSGQVVDGTTVVVRIDRVDPVAVDVALPEGALSRVAPGQTASVTLQTESTPRTATVAYVSPRLDDSTRTVAVRLTLPNPDGVLRPGQSAHVHLVTDHVDAALLVPTQAVVESGGGPGVYVAGADQKAELRPVKLGTRGAEQVEVVDGVKAGDSVIVGGIARLRPGAAITVAP